MRFRKQIVVGTATTGLAATLIASGLLAGPTAGTGSAASHVDAPSLIADPQMDGSDLYAFVCPDDADMVCIVTNYSPFQLGSGKGFATDARYEVNVDQHGTGTPDITYRWTFDKPEGGAQPYRLEEVRAGKKPETLVSDGKASLTGSRDGAVAKIPGGGRTLATKAADSFFTNGKIVGMSLTGNAIIPNIDLINVLNGNVNSMVLQVPRKKLAMGGDVERNPVVGIWATASRKSLGGDGYRQMSRLANPATDVLTFFSMGEHLNASSPVEDQDNAKLTGFVRSPKAPALVKASHWTAKVPPTPRDDLWQIYFTGIAGDNGPIKDDLNAHVLNQDVDASKVIPCDELRLNMGIAPVDDPSRFGLVENDRQGYPNGRRIGDDIHATQLRMLLGEPAGPGNPELLVEHMDKVTGPATPVSSTFPYVAMPN